MRSKRAEPTPDRLAWLDFAAFHGNGNQTPRKRFPIAENWGGEEPQKGYRPGRVRSKQGQNKVKIAGRRVLFLGGCCCVRAGCAGAWRACSPNDGQSRPKIGSQAARQSASSPHAWAPTRPRCAVYVGVAWPKVGNVEVGATAIILIFMSPALEKAPRTTANRTYEWTDTPPPKKEGNGPK